MSSIRDQILTAVNTALNATGAPCTFFRCRQDEFQIGELPAGNMFPKKLATQIDAKESMGILTIEVACIVATTQDPVDQAADPLLVWAESKIMAPGNLGGLCTFIESVSVEWFMEQKGAEQCGAIMTFDIHFRTALTDAQANQS